MGWRGEDLGSPSNIQPFAIQPRTPQLVSRSKTIFSIESVRPPRTLDDGTVESLEKLTASHRHGMLRLTLPLKESVKPHRVQIETQREDQKRLAGVR